ncbi:YcnI family protein [Kineosporia sp. A_224]|uniref:YcnI family copper-binding membrane protein n=1 Tax=Kineosporia sp. A_224 TaxID=1962180 RepID=UPI00130458EE|nr:YcnI family protein [Kineosporia sp. A_224]
MPAPSRRSRSARRAGAVAALTLALAVVAGPAAAHVTVSADDDRRGAQDVLLTFRVPNEADDSTTVKVEVKLPSRTPLGSVLPAPVAGWTVTTSEVDLDAPVTTDDGAITRGVATVTWTADKGTKGIPVGGFQAFQLLVGPLPDADSLAFPTVQTYANGTSESWVDPVTDPANPPESPAPRLTLRAAADGEAAGAGTAASGTSGDAAGDAAGGGSGDGPGAYGIAGLVLGAVGAVLGAVAFWRTGRRSA